MKKDHTRDYVTEAFRAYAAAGMPTYEEEKARIYDEALRRHSTTDAATAMSQAEIAVENATPYLLDVLAVEKTLSLLEHGGKDVIARAVKEVYFTAPLDPLTRGELSTRVRRFALRCPANESTVYRWLKEARFLCAAYRGLRILDEDARKYRIAMQRCE